MRRLLAGAAKKLLFPGGEGPRPVLFGAGKGVRYHLDPAEKSQRILGLEEQEIARWFVNLASRAGGFIDIGASDGFYTVWAAKLNDTAIVIGAEPQEALRVRFESNLALNGLAPGERIQWRAELVGLEHTPLDELAATLPSPALIKIDVDGYEVDVLKSGPEVLARADTSAIIEVHSPELEAGVIELLESVGFRCQIVDHAWWRRMLPEQRADWRPVEHNRWVVAIKGR